MVQEKQSHDNPNNQLTLMAIKNHVWSADHKMAPLCVSNDFSFFACSRGICFCAYSRLEQFFNDQQMFAK